MARRSEHTQEQIREMVLNAAESIVIQEGFDALTVRKVAMAIGYTVGSIYMVFDNMSDLAMHVKGRTLDELADEMLDSQSDAGDSEQELLALATVYLEFAHDHYNRWRMIFEAASDQPIPDWYQEKINRLFAIVEDLCQAIMPTQNPEQIRMASRALWSGVHGVCVLSLNGSLGRVGIHDAEATVRLLVSHFLQGWTRSQGLADAEPQNK